MREGEPNPQGLPVLKKLSSCFVYNSAREVSSFECSNELFTKTHRLIERAERSNMQSVLTDCPHRESWDGSSKTICAAPAFYTTTT